MTSHPDAFARKPLWLGLAAVLAVVGTFVLWDALVRGRHIVELSARYGVTVDAPRVDAQSPTGYEAGRRSLLLPAADTAHWVMQTQTMMAEGSWRLRHVDYDNAPEGRAVHWAAPLHWWLAGLAWIDRLWSDRPTGLAVERATLTAGPVMLGLLLLGVVPWLGRRFSPAAAGLTALGCVAVYPFYSDFLPGRTDHHGLANLCALLTVLGMAGGAGAPHRGAARRWLILSAVAGGTGLWISAATQAPVLLGLGLGLLAAGWAGRKAATGFLAADGPGLLRFWGWLGGGVSLLAWLVEYFPSSSGWRLEVNHPLYALAWGGAGETLRAALLAMRNGGGAAARRDRLAGLGGAVLVALLPAVIVCTAGETFIVADSFVWRLHALCISEFQGLAGMAAAGLSGSWLALLLPLLLLVPAAGLVVRPGTPPAVRAQLLLVLVPALLGWLLGWSQVRWLGLSFALSVPVLAVFFRALAAGGAARRTILLWTGAGALVLLPGAVLAVQRSRAAGEFTPEEIRRLAERDVAHWLNQRAGGGRVVVAATPTPTSNLVFLGGLSGLGTLYWENVTGLKKAAALFAAPSPEAARELAQRWGVTHIVLFSWDAFDVSLAKLYRGVPDAQPYPPDLFVAQLLSAPVPPAWLRPLALPLPPHAALAGAQVRIWEVGPDQTPARATARAANCYLELGRPEVAQLFAPSLQQYPGDLAASVMLAGIAAGQRDAAAFTPAFARVLTQLGQADTLELDEQLHLAVVLAIGQQMERAQAQLRQAMSGVNEASLRRLTPGTLADLLTLSEALEVRLPDPALAALARQLVPPGKRP